MTALANQHCREDNKATEEGSNEKRRWRQQHKSTS